jgi:tripartite-type tricarboxylate transporter receptor subunit TctC
MSLPHLGIHMNRALNPTPNRRDLLSMAAAAASAVALPAMSQTEKYPSRIITLVVPFPAGGAVDTAGRAIADKLSKALGQVVVVDNKGGAGGSIGSTYVAKAKADGYTLLVTSQSSHVANPAVTPNLPYDAVKDFSLITIIERLPNVMLVNPTLPVKSLAEFVAYAKARPGKLNYASSGNGSMLQLNMELFKSQYGVFITHIPYRAAGTALTDLLAGRVDVMFNNLGASNAALVKSGKLRALAVAAPLRSSLLPDVPTFGELKQVDLNLTSWTGLAAPAGTPELIIAQLYTAVRGILQDPQNIVDWKKRGALVPEAVRPDEYQKEIVQRIAFYKKLAKDNNIVAD